MGTLILLALFLLAAAPLPAQAPAPKPSIHLSWDANREPDVAYYRVWRSGAADGPWVIAGVVWARPADKPPERSGLGRCGGQGILVLRFGG